MEDAGAEYSEWDHFDRAVTQLLGVLSTLISFLVLAVVLVLVDLNFGIAAARNRERKAIAAGQKFEEIRFSRAGRRTLNKITDYIC